MNLLDTALTIATTNPVNNGCAPGMDVPVILSLSSLLPGDLCALDENSEEVFYEFVQLSAIDHSAFSYNWPYVIQATRKQGFYYKNRQAIIYFYFRKHTNNVQQYKLIVVNHLGHNSEELVHEIADAAKKLAIATIVKNIDRDRILLWNDLGFTETVEPWSKYSFRDDNTFPEFVYDIKKFINLQVTRQTRSIINKFLREAQYTFLHYDQSFKESAVQLLEKTSEYLENKGVDFKEEVFLAHQFVFDDNIRNKTIFVVLEGTVLVGVTCLTQFKENLFVNAVFSESKSNLMRFFLWKSVVCYCESLEACQQPIYLALQGSENEGQNNWKRFFCPIRVIHRTHMTNSL